MDLAIDTQTFMRLVVSRRIETALGVAHLQQDPTKYPKEDFMSPKTLTLIEDVAKVREDLTWTMEARKTVTSDRPPLFQSRLCKSPGGGKRNQPPRHAGRTGTPGLRAPAKEKASQRKSSGTNRKQKPIPTPLSKGGLGPHSGLGYLFDSTLGYRGRAPPDTPACGAESDPLFAVGLLESDPHHHPTRLALTSCSMTCPPLQR